MIKKIKKGAGMIRGNERSILVEKVNEIIDHLNANIVQCSCPPWYRQYLRDEFDPNKDTVLLRGRGWTCPMHGQINT